MIELLLVLLSPVSVMSNEQVRDWPKLAVIEHRVSTVAMRDVCVKYTPGSPMACSTFDFFRRECHIWLSKDFPAEQLLAHELGHCQGRPHLGDSSREQMESMVAQWKARQRGTQSQAAK